MHTPSTNHAQNMDVDDDDDEYEYDDDYVVEDAEAYEEEEQEQEPEDDDEMVGEDEDAMVLAENGMLARARLSMGADVRSQLRRAACFYPRRGDGRQRQ